MNSITHSPQEFKSNNTQANNPRRAASAANSLLDSVRRAIEMELQECEVAQRFTIYLALLQKAHVSGAAGALIEVAS